MKGTNMTLSRRDAMIASSSAVAGLAFAAMTGTEAGAQVQPQEAWPDQLVEKGINPAFPGPLPLLADGSAPEHAESEAGPITGRLMWHTADRKTPPGESDYRKMAIKVDTRGLGKLSGTLHFSDLEKLPRVSHTFLLQCGTPEPHGIVKWTGVKFSDFADMLGLVPHAYYARFIAADQNFYIDEAVGTLRHPQVMLAWMMNDQPIPPDHGAPLRLIVPFRYGNRSIKAIKEISFSSGTMPPPPV
jgi:DMSO/TMAO reductase YedYZ molybdopterin-dependent catalytic subunit